MIWPKIKKNHFLTLECEKSVSSRKKIEFCRENKGRGSAQLDLREKITNK